MDAVRLVLGIRRSARAVQHAGPAGPEARRGGSQVGGRRVRRAVVTNDQASVQQGVVST